MNRYDVLPVTRCFRSREFLNANTVTNNSFGKKKSRGQLFVVAGRAHRCRNRFLADPNLERLFNREIIMLIFKRAVLPAADNLPGSDSVLFHRFDANDIIRRCGNLSPLHFARSQFCRTFRAGAGRLSDDRIADGRVRRRSRAAERSLLRLQDGLQRTGDFFLARSSRSTPRHIGSARDFCERGSAKYFHAGCRS